MDKGTKAILAKEIEFRLEDLLGDGKYALTPDNFAVQRISIEHAIFPAAEEIIDIKSIRAGYEMELLQSSEPNHPSVGRLGYIREHLQKLLTKVKEYNNK